MLIRKDKNKELEKVLANKNIDEQAKNLLQGILYKIEASYKDYKKVKGKKQTEEKYVEELINNISEKCDKISIIKLSEKLTDKKIQKQLEKNKFYVGEEIISYPIEEKILYAIEKKSRKIINNKYGEAVIGVSELINTGKNMDRIELLRDFNGWSWTTINKEIENIEANFIYQTLQIILGEEFFENWYKDGTIDYMNLFIEKISKYGDKIAQEQKDLLIKIAIASTIKNNKEYAKKINAKLKKLEKEFSEFEDTEQKIREISNEKKSILKQLNELEIKIAKEKAKQLQKEKKQLMEQLERKTYLLNPSNYIKEKSYLSTQKEEVEKMKLTENEMQQLLIQYTENFLKCFKKIVKKTTNEEEILRLIYQFRYFMLLPFNLSKSVKDIEKLQKSIKEVQKELVEKAINKKVITNIPIEIMNHVFETRIIILEELYYKITLESGKYYVQIFDENISEEKFEITPVEKIKINKKIKIFI